MVESLRNRRKQERRQAILKSAEHLFRVKGFRRTTMEEIAGHAHLGVATVYKYFGTKAAILEGIIRPTLELAFAEAEKIIVNPPSDPGVAMAELVARYRHLRNDWSDRKMLRAVSVMATENDGAIPALVREADARCQQQMRDLLLVLRGRGDLSPGLNLDDAAFVTFCVFNQHYEHFLTDESVPAEKLFADLARRTRLLFRNWTKR